MTNVEITSAVLGLGVARTANSKEQHPDLAATLDFQCKDAARAAYVDVCLFEAFADIKRIDVQVAGPRGQFKRNLRRPERRVTLTR